MFRIKIYVIELTVKIVFAGELGRLRQGIAVTDLMLEVQKLHARDLRVRQTDAERLLWRNLRNRQLLNCKFRRQHLIGHYIVDFVCLEKRLVIELDGGQHLEQQIHDEKRTHYLAGKGFDVIRFWNDEVLKQLDAVLNVIFLKLLDPHPGPLPKRERE